MNYWSWRGKYIGFRDDDFLFSKTGKPLGYFSGDEAFDFDGNYIGEIMNTDRIIVYKSKRTRRNSCCAKPCKHAGMSYCDYVGYAMLVGYEDFVIKEK